MSNICKNLYEFILRILWTSCRHVISKPNQMSSCDFLDNGIQETQHTKLSGDVSNRTPVESKKSNDNEVCMC